jgi:hypothetical protein
MPTVNDLTDPGEIETEPAKAKPPGVSALAGVLTDLGFTALFAWIIGIALNQGFGVSVPFSAAWLLLLAALYLAQLFTGQLSRIWHRERVKADIDLLAATMAAQDMIQAQQAGGLDAFLCKLDKSADKDTGAYL